MSHFSLVLWAEYLSHESYVSTLVKDVVNMIAQYGEVTLLDLNKDKLVAEWVDLPDRMGRLRSPTYLHRREDGWIFYCSHEPEGRRRLKIYDYLDTEIYSADRVQKVEHDYPQPDGCLLFIRETQLISFDFETLKASVIYTFPTSIYEAVVMSTKWVVAYDRRANYILYDLVRGIQRPISRFGECYCLASGWTVPKGTSLADEYLYAWNITSQLTMRRINLHTLVVDSKYSVNCSDLLGNYAMVVGRVIGAYSSFDRTYHLRDLQTGKLLKTIPNVSSPRFYCRNQRYYLVETITNRDPPFTTYRFYE